MKRKFSLPFAITIAKEGGKINNQEYILYLSYYQMMSSNTIYRQRIKSNNHNQPADILFELLSDDEFQYTIRARFIMLVQIEFSFYFDLNFSLKFGCLCNAL